jgi:hypothetical protein
MKRAFFTMVVTVWVVAAAQAQAAGEWKPFYDLVGHFNVLLPRDPGAPTVNIHREGSDLTMGRIYTVFVGESEPKSLYGVGFLDNKPIPVGMAPDAFLDGLLDSIVQQSNAKLQHSEKITIGSPFPFCGREFRLAGDKFQIDQYAFTNHSMMAELPGLGNGSGAQKGPKTIVGRIYLVNHRIMVLWYLADAGAFDERLARKFLNSFQLGATIFIP